MRQLLGRDRPKKPPCDEAVLSGEGHRRRWNPAAKYPLVLPLLGLGLALTLLAGTGVAGQGGNPHADERIGTVQEVYDCALLPDIQVNTFRNIDRLFPTRTIRRGHTVYPLPPSPRPLQNIQFTSHGSLYDLYDYVALNRVSGLLVLKDGKVAFETYQLGNHAHTRWITHSAPFWA